MPASTKKHVFAVYLTNVNITATSTTKNGGGALTKTGQAVAPSTLTTPAAVAGIFNASSFLGNAANIEAVNLITSASTNRLLSVRTVAVPTTDTLVASVTTGALHNANVFDVTAFVDAGLTADAEAAVLTDLMTALGATISSP